MIPITFNHDDENNVKKGNIRGQDLASFLSISMPKRAGILDIFDDPCGYVQVVPSTTYATITMKKGYINIYGRCIYVEQGEQVQVALPSSGSVSGTFGIRINLGETGANEVSWFTKTTTLRTDNILNNEVNGIYEFGLFNYTATASGLTLTKIAPTIQNIDDYLKGANFTTLATADNSTKLANAQFVQNVANTLRTTYKQNGSGKGSNGYLKLDNGIMLKWGFARTQSGSDTQTVAFDSTEAFTTVFTVLVTAYNESTGYDIKVTNITASGFTYSVGTDRTDCLYLAIGI